MQRPWTSVTFIGIIAMLCLQTLQASPFVNTNTSVKLSQEELRSVIQHRFQFLDFPFQVEYTEQVEELILDYLVLGRRETEKILGRSNYYFPIFEHYLEAHQLPNELKYIPFIESRLRPQAKSSTGARGLWQFMPATARGYGLKTTNEVDERLDPHLSTQAAAEMLSQLFEDFGDWSLALAAYNCGPGRVRKAMKKTGCSNFWDIQEYLPRQTRKYIPAFLAATYVNHYYQAHQLLPKRPKHLPFIATTCNFPPEAICNLNPKHTKQFISVSIKGSCTLVPDEATCPLENYSSKCTDSPIFTICAFSTDEISTLSRFV